MERVSDSQAGRGHREARAGARDLQVAQLHELESAADREALHPRNEGLLDTPDDLVSVRDHRVVGLDLCGG